MMREIAAIVVMGVVVLAVYFPIPATPQDNALLGMDYVHLHERRIRYAQEAIFGAHPHLPGWYSRELMGTPFWSNIQSFPFIPTRLALLWIDPVDLYLVAVELAAFLAALFTYLYYRRIGLGILPAGAAGFTFACSGYFASRVMAGHLPLLEAYPSLPFLFWLIERLHAGQSRASWRLMALGCGAAVVVLAGHPQLPAYSLIAAVVYALYRLRGMGRLRAVLAMALGVGCSAFVLLPMLMLIGQSTRILPLDPPANDVVFPIARLKAFVAPWADGWFDPVDRSPLIPFHSYPNAFYFWDTVCYVGLLPLIAAAVLVVRMLVRRRRPPSPWTFLAVMGAIALLLAFPVPSRLFALLPGTLFRSTSRQLYLTSFSLAMGLGGAVALLLRYQIASRTKLLVVAALCAIALHIFDLGSHDRAFVRMIPIERTVDPAQLEDLKSRVGDGRVAFDIELLSPLNREIDDVGFFDSIMLAKPYAALLDVAGLPAQSNVQLLNGPELSDRALAFAGVTCVVDPQWSGRMPSHPSRRAEFFPESRVIHADRAAIHQMLRDPATDLGQVLIIPRATPEGSSISQVVSAAKDGAASAAEAPARYTRPSSDEIDVGLRVDRPGYLRVLEAYHPGWSAVVDDRPGKIVIADDAFLAVPLDRGAHTVRLTFSTPLATTGQLISIASFICLVVLSFFRTIAKRGWNH